MATLDRCLIRVTEYFLKGSRLEYRVV